METIPTSLPRIDTLQIIYQLINAVVRAQDINHIYEEAFDVLQRTLNVNGAAILLFDAYSVARFKALRGLSDDYIKAAEAHSPWSPIDVNPQPVLVADVLAEPSLQTINHAMQAEGIQALGYIPLIFEDRLLGTLMLYFDAPHRFTEDEVQIARIIAGHVAFAIEWRRAEERLNASEEQFSKVFTANPDPMAITTFFDARYLDVNDSFLRITGYERHEIIGRTIYDLGIFADTEEFSHFRQELLAKKSVHELETGFRMKSGEVRVGVFSAEIINVEGRPCVLTVTTDVTERKRLEKEREQLLAREQAARADAESANKAKDEFLAMVSHELRAPLNSIVGWVHLLRRGDAETISRASEIIEAKAKHLAHLINDLLDVSRITSGNLKLNVRLIDLEAIVNSVISETQSSAEAKMVCIGFEGVPAISPVVGDPDRLQQLIRNLLSNAVKFTPKGGEVRVALEPIDGYAQLTVSDTGIGIRPELLPFVFDRFWQADETSQRESGLGLGLAIAKHIVELHGGEIQAESDGEGKGARFIVRFPV